MGQKVNPNGLRLGINKDWEAKWYSNNKDFSNIFLKYKAFQYSMNLGDYTEGINIWNKFFSKEKVITIKKGCGCHGNFI